MLTRRETLAWLARAGVAVTLPVSGAAALGGAPADLVASGYGNDPDLLDPKIPWPLSLTKDQRRWVTRLADLMLPEDGGSPAASALGVPAFIDEWISAPYPIQREDRRLLFFGRDWLDREAGGDFAALAEEPAANILDALWAAIDPDPSRMQARQFFARFRQICLIGYYTTDSGQRAIGYIGNQPSADFAGPSAKLIARLTGVQD